MVCLSRWGNPSHRVDSLFGLWMTLCWRASSTSTAAMPTCRRPRSHSWHFLTEGGGREGHWMLTRDSSLSSQPFLCNSALIAIAAEVPRLGNVNWRRIHITGYGEAIISAGWRHSSAVAVRSPILWLVTWHAYSVRKPNKFIDSSGWTLMESYFCLLLGLMKRKMLFMPPQGRDSCNII